MIKMIFFIRFFLLAFFFAIPRIVLRIEVLHNNPHFLNFIYTSYDMTWRLVIYSIAFSVVMNCVFQISKKLFFLILTSLFVFELSMLLYFQYFSIFPFLESFILLVNVFEVSGHILNRLSDFWIFLLFVLYVSILVTGVFKNSILVSKNVSIITVFLMFVMHLIDFKRYVVTDYIFDRNTATFKIGLLGLYIHNFYDLIGKSELPLVKFNGVINADPVVLVQKRTQKNIIVVQVESLDYAYFEVHKDSMKSVLDHAIYYKNFYAMHSAGGSSDAEFSLYTGLLPSARSPSLRSYLYDDKNDLAYNLKSLGYQLAFFHPFRLSFYDRKSAYAKMGFDILCDEYCLSGEASGWYAKDRVFYEQVFERIKKLKQPFFSQLVTIQSHGPFENYDSTKCNATTTEGAYDCTMKEVLPALSNFIKTVFSDVNLAGNTVIYVFGDHESAIKPMDGRRHRVPFLVFEKGQKGDSIMFPVSQIDVPSIILRNLGISKGVGLGSYPSTNNRIICYNDGGYIGSKSPVHDSICEYAKLYSASRLR